MKSLIAIDKIYEINNFLLKYKESNQIINYKIVLQLGMRIEVNILVDEIKGKKWYFEKEPFIKNESIIKINEFEFEEGSKKDYELIFTQHIDLGLRRRLTNLIEQNTKEINKPCPVITFYSYKGGTGRTTSLAFFASWLATHHSKKVIIIDCDFEAPGLTNYFDISEERKGITEYLLDAEYAKLKGETLDIKRDYAHKVRYEYVGKGDIYIVPAGNLSIDKVNDFSDRTYRADYLEALARLDITSVNHILEQFEGFFNDIKNQLELDFENSIILIDSRTGFNDTFAVLSSISDIIVGFFGINKQSKVGLTQFIDSFGTVENTRNKQIILVNSISEDRSHEIEFKEIINSYVSENENKFTDEIFGKIDFINNIFRIPRRDFLGRIGTTLENKDKGILKIIDSIDKEPLNIEFHDKVQRPDSEFEDFFNGIYEKADFLVENYKQSNTPQIEYVPIVPYVNQKNPIKKFDETFFATIKNKVDKIISREKVLKTLIQLENFPKSYAETGKEKPQLDDFFFRDCMKDIFNRDKYVVIGYKGTGKTHIYRSFENTEIAKILCKREKQNPDNYIFVNVIPIMENLKYFSTDEGFKEEEKKINENIGKDYFFKSFWIIYSWSSLFRNSNIQKLKVTASIDLFDINESNVGQILNIISNRDKMTSITKDLENIDNALLSVNKTVILSYDQIDFVVKPNKWNEGVAPLINFWRTNSYSRIFPKIFVRADIFENRLGNITNFNEIQLEKSISLQWSKQELFAYFFKYVFKVSKEDFFALSYSYKDYQESTKNMLLKIDNDLDEQSQISIKKEEYLRFLVEKFFGKSSYRYGEKKNTYGDTYDWFDKNLTDAKNAISIRPFLDLMKKAIEIALDKKNLENAKQYFYQQNQILSGFYYTSNSAKAHAAKIYYEDLLKDPGNEPLNFFYKYIKNDGLEKFRVYEFTRELLDDLLKRIIDFPSYLNEESLKGRSIDDFKNLLINNGVLAVNHITNRQFTRYTIPFLYRSFFGVGNPNLSASKTFNLKSAKR